MQHWALLAAPKANRRTFNGLRSFPWNTCRWHVVCSPICNIKDWLPGVAGTDPRLGYRFWGVNYEKGACTSPLFYFQSRFSRPNQWFLESPRRVPSPGKSLFPDSFQDPVCIKKMSGRWGERPLGRGDGGYCSLKLVRAFRPFHRAREQQDGTQEQTGHNRCRTPENPNNFRLPAQFVFHPIRRR